MFKPKVTISADLMSRLKQVAELVGCSSVEEYVERVLTAETDKILNGVNVAELAQGDVDAIAKKLKGLGYLE